jgi:hypothetical protein
MRYQYVFNTELRNGGSGDESDLLRMASVAKQGGYNFLLWNKNVYFIGGAKPQRTGLTKADLF